MFDFIFLYNQYTTMHAIIIIQNFTIKQQNQNWHFIKLILSVSGKCFLHFFFFCNLCFLKFLKILCYFVTTIHRKQEIVNAP